MFSNILYSLSTVELFLIIAICFVVLSLVFTMLINRRVKLEYRRRENDAIVCISAIISVIYAVLVGFTVLYELGAFDKAVQAEKEEGRAIFNIYHNALHMPEPVSAEIRQQIVNYGTYVVENEWPQMEDGKKQDRQAVNYINKITDVLNTLHKEQINTLNNSQTATLDKLDSLNNSLFDLHEERTAKAHMSIIPGMWLVLLLGTVMTIGMTTILGMERRLHLICVTATSLLLAAVIYLLFIIDNPYRGGFAVQPWTIVSTLKFIGWQKNNDISAADINKIEDKSAGQLPQKHFLIP